ncbi:MAG: arginine--tRNA ligase [Candidatus Staskawiczbacteria bacterium RIFCSPHIGHO2_02_FULL_42_22]|uniref:Arginine--tRNA ligase n=2 Tax=Candidatus Staskawicziibacteriota TaxID=1817916 RepID=A0A1G2I4E9_9BACT|nr:MAG: arginine--tRNA ligase [Candidatus Staskawiczbacteria bacterium RIFCSPHIGHO2_01_FULL_41_41]OGZ69643.1 MAG: arginine--tRNA ligase [Candidatus Staskawiczbacteria bacterium RIFCSPHIGHO2_02_FULL_42_22]HLD79278.1 arginine--tRNA ligase [Candidatus Nanoarchaeia archaeon]
MNFKEEIIKLLAKETKQTEEELTNLIAVPPDPGLGDYAFPCFKLGKNAKEEAEKLKAKLELPEFVSKVEVAGPYLNFFIKHNYLARETLHSIYKQAKQYGKPTQQKGKRTVIEYCGPNTNKPLHLGHIRNMALGNAICRILSFVGNEVHPVNIINDRGIHICQSMLAYQKWGHGKEPDKKEDHFVGDFYVLFAKHAKESEKQGEILKNEAQELLLKWERDDKETKKLWKKMNSWVLAGFAETYRRFGISFEKEYAESDYYLQGKELVYEGLKKSIFQKDPKTGAIVAPLEKYKLPNKVLLRGDDTSIYITQDMYLATLRYRDFKFQQMMYVVASEQRLHFQQLFKILELLGKDYAKDMHHISYGLVNLPTGRMKSREGTVVDADDIMGEVAEMAKIEIKKRHSHLSEREVEERADLIALAAIKFFMLKTDADKDIVYNPEESLSFEGETGPYLQYTYVRTCSLLRKAKNEHHLQPTYPVNFEVFALEEELKILRLMTAFQEAVVKAAEMKKPHLLATYLITLAQAFNEFYHKCPVLSEDKNQTKARLLLVDGVRQVLENGLNLLGIKMPQEM